MHKLSKAFSSTKSIASFEVKATSDYVRADKAPKISQIPPKIMVTAWQIVLDLPSVTTPKILIPSQIWNQNS